MSLNNTLVVGNVGNLKLNTTKSGIAVANFSVAVNEKINNEERTTWYQVTAWDGVANAIARFVQKGTRVLVEGRVSAEAWTDKNGKSRATLKLNANKVEFLARTKEQREEPL